ncbi:MAG: hypothetical protein ACE5FA_12580 [Dehalococcoidia bacterium]
MSEQTLELTGLDGSNPLAFLAALGTLRALTRAWPDQPVRMSWTQSAGWHPMLATRFGPDDVIEALHSEVRSATVHPTLTVADDLTLDGPSFRRHLRTQVDAACNEESTSNTGPTEYAAAFGCDAICDERSGRIADTALRTMSGAGHQHFLKTMRSVLQQTKAADLDKTLFQPWRYNDPLQNLNLRFDPLDDKRYALRWDDPSGDPTRRTRGNMLGANALAVLGIPMLPTAPMSTRLETTGFRGHRSHDCYWTWPIWKCAIGCDTVCSLLAHGELQSDVPNRRLLSALGVAEIFRSQRITVGKFRNLTTAQAV